MSRLWTVAVLVAFAPVARAADDDPKEIVAKAIKAHGGEEYLSKHPAVQATEKGKINIPGVGEADMSQESAYMLPDKFKHTIEFEAMNLKIRFVAISNGDKVSVDATVNGQAADLGTNLKEAYKTVPVVIRISHLTPLLKDKSYELSLIGEDKVDDKKVIGVRVSKKSQKDVNVYFDKETGLLTKMEYQTIDASTGKDLNEERIVKEYMKNKDGIMVPKKTVIKQDGKVFAETETVEMKFLESLEDSEFKK